LFSGGINGVGVIPNTPTPFAGGQTAGPITVTGLDYFLFPFNMGDTLPIQVLEEDVALIILMVWIPLVADPASTYQLSTHFDFLDYFNLWGYNMVLSMAVNPSLAKNKNFMTGVLATDSLSSASNLSIVNQDAYASQACIDGIDYVITNPNVLY